MGRAGLSNRREAIPMKNSSQHLIAEVPRRRSTVEITIRTDLGDVWSRYCTLNEDGEVIDCGRFRMTPKGDRAVVYGRPPLPRGDGGWDAFDLDQRTAAGAWTRSDRGERPRVAGDLA